MHPNDLLSELVSYRTYNKTLVELDRKETFIETVDRLQQQHLDFFPKHMSDDIVRAFKYVHSKKVMPSMRALQYGGAAILKNHCRQYNCSYLPIDDISTFSEILFLLLSGCGVGYSVQRQHISNLPKVTAPTESGIFFVQDSIQGWAQGLQALITAYFTSGIRPILNYSNIRAAGTWLETTAARAPGPDELEKALALIETKLRCAIGRQLTSLEVHDIICIASDCVVSGGVRRAALIALFDAFDELMLRCKSGNWRETHPYRARANNSAVLPRDTTTFEEYSYVFDACKASFSGEPGFAWSNNTDYGWNPCAEASLRRNTFCNLTTVNQTDIVSEHDFMERVEAAAFIGTLQSAYTDFPFLNKKWKANTEQDRLLGVSFTGIADTRTVTNDMLRRGAQLVLDVNERYARPLGIELAARTTVVKPEGSSSCVLKSASGIHARKGRFIIRRLQINDLDPMLAYLKTKIPGLIEPANGVPNTSVVSIPQAAPEGSIIEQDESAFDLFGRTLDYARNWVAPGHRRGDNKHNVSCTLSVRDEEWDGLRQLMWDTKADYAGISLFPFDNGTYVQAPFEVCTEQEYNRLADMTTTIDLKEVKVNEHTTSASSAISCAGGACEITSI